MDKRKIIHVNGLAIFVLLTLSCGILPKKLAWDDEELAPMLEAIAEVDRSSLGFTPIPEDAEIDLEGPSTTYDAMLHIYGDQNRRTIAFRKTDSGYRWIHEQEIHIGPKCYTTPEGTFHEEIIVTYDVERVSGVPLNQIDIDYRGEDPRLANRPELTLADVTPIIAEWQSVTK